MSNVKTEVNGKVGIATLNRPEALNALSTPLLNELADALEAWDRGTEVRCMIVTGSERAFAAGADIKEMQPKSYSQMYRENLFGEQFDRIARIKKPIIAAVAGHALGGGCELALVCDFIIAADTAKFGQPEITLGIMPGLGGTPTSDPHYRQVQGDGSVPDRAGDGCVGSRSQRLGVPGGAGRPLDGRGPEGGPEDRRPVLACRPDGEGGGGPRL